MYRCQLEVPGVDRDECHGRRRSSAQSQVREDDEELRSARPASRGCSWPRRRCRRGPPARSRRPPWRSAPTTFFSATPEDATGTIQIDCNPRENIQVTLSKGSSSTYTTRTLKNGTNALNYNLYRDSARTQILGDGTGGSSIQSNNNVRTRTFHLWPSAGGARRVGRCLLRHHHRDRYLLTWSVFRPNTLKVSLAADATDGATSTRPCHRSR